MLSNNISCSKVEYNKAAIWCSVTILNMLYFCLEKLLILRKEILKNKIPSVVTSAAWQEYHRIKENEKRERNTEEKARKTSKEK